jgi:hypothetical protein
VAAERRVRIARRVRRPIRLTSEYVRAWVRRAAQRRNATESLRTQRKIDKMIR